MINLRYVGPIGQRSGYAQATHDTLMAIQAAGIDLDIEPLIEMDTDNVEARYQSLIPYIGAAPDSHWPTHLLIHTIPHAAAWLMQDYAPPPHVSRILMTTWETDNFPRDVAAEIAEHYDLVIVPCQWNAEVFRAAGLEKVVVLPHAFDAKWWNLADVRRPLSPITFYTILTWCERKNPIGLLKAYLTEFTGQDDVLLKIVTPSYTVEDFDSLVRSLGLTNLPPVEFVGPGGNRLSPEALRLLHYASHAYVSAARGEGWGLGAFEAAIAGNIVIAPQFGGFLDFLDGYPGTRYVPCFKTPAITPEAKTNTVLQVGNLKISPVVINAPTGITAAQSWAEPDLHFMKLVMRATYNRLRQEPTERHSSDMLRVRFDYPEVGRRIKKILEAL